MIKTCKTCVHWRLDSDENPAVYDMCSLGNHQPTSRGFEVRACCQPTQTFCKSPIERNGFGLADAEQYFAVMATAEDFGCVRHEPLPTEESR